MIHMKVAKFVLWKQNYALYNMFSFKFYGWRKGKLTNMAAYGQS